MLPFPIKLFSLYSYLIVYVYVKWLPLALGFIYICVYIHTRTSREETNLEVASTLYHCAMHSRMGILRKSVERVSEENRRPVLPLVWCDLR